MIYRFDNAAGQIIKRAVIQTTMSLAKSGVFTFSELTRSVSTYYQKPEYDFNDNANPSNSGKFTEKLVQLRFEPKGKYYDSNRKLVTTPQLDIQLCEIDISKQNDIIRTRVVNEEGTIKEAWSGGDDWQINITGVLVGNQGVYSTEGYEMLLNKPNADTQKLVDISNSLLPIDVTCPLLNNRGIYRIVIESIELPHESEWKNLQKFALKCYSHNNDLTI